MDQRVEPWQLYFLGGILLLPAIIVGGLLITEKLAFDRDVALVTERRIDQLQRRLMSADGEDRLLENYSLTFRLIGPPNVLSVAAGRCDIEIVGIFLGLAGNEMSLEYVQDAESYFELQPAARKCPQVGEMLRHQAKELR